MHVPDGFWTCPRRPPPVRSPRSGSGSPCVVPAASSTTAPPRWRPGGDVRVRRADAQLPGGRRHQRPLAGGALAAVLAGPWTAVLVLAVVLLVQSLLFADGGITALGTNITLLGLVGVLTGWLVFRGLQAVLPKRLSLVPAIAAVAGYVSVPVTALAFVGLYAVGGQAPISLDTLTTAMVGWHSIIGIGEAAITGLVVGSVVAVRPDLVYGARRVLVRRELVVRSPERSGA